MFYFNVIMKRLKCKKRTLDDVTLQYSIVRTRSSRQFAVFCFTVISVSTK